MLFSTGATITIDTLALPDEPSIAPASTTLRAASFVHASIYPFAGIPQGVAQAEVDITDWLD